MRKVRGNRCSQAIDTKTWGALDQCGRILCDNLAQEFRPRRKREVLGIDTALGKVDEIGRRRRIGLVKVKF